MNRRHLGLFLFLLCFPFFTGTGCSCGDGPNVGVNCKKNSDCAPEEACPRAKNPNGCICNNEQCLPRGGQQCSKNDDCGEGLICTSKGICGAKERCESDKDCTDPEKPRCDVILGICKKRKVGDTCQAATECPSNTKCCAGGDSTKRCNYPKCFKDADCVKGQAAADACIEPISCNAGITPACVQGVCKCQAPCGGGECGDGKCCDASKDQCIDNPSPCPGLKCAPGEGPPDFSKYQVDSKSCKVTGPACQCVKLPPLPVGVSGQHSELGLLGGKPIVSAYNKDYGDLVVGTRQGDGSMKWEFVDGIPQGGKVEGALDGPRGGIKEKGDDVGKYTSIVITGSTPHVSYHDVTNGTLKYATKQGGKWSHHIVDKNGKGIGRFTSIAAAGNNPVIAYFVEDDGKGQSALRIARANSAAPKSASDWTIQTIASAKAPGCGGKCDAKKKEVCAVVGGKPTCQTPSADADKCKPKACQSSGEACVNNQCVKTVPDDPNPPLPIGIGLFPSLVLRPNGSAVIAYYDNINKDLKLAAQGSGPSSNFQVRTLKSQGDIGQFPSASFHQGSIHIAYIDSDNADVRYLKLDAALKPTVDEVVDNGFANVPGGGEDRFLADTSIAVDSQGIPRIVYQDASAQSLKIAIRQGAKTWRKVKLAGEDNPYKGAFGFFADQVLDGSKSYISSFKYNLRQKTSGLDLRTWQ